LAITVALMLEFFPFLARYSSTKIWGHRTSILLCWAARGQTCAACTVQRTRQNFWGGGRARARGRVKGLRHRSGVDRGQGDDMDSSIVF